MYDENGVGGCLYSSSVTCFLGERDCDKCGFNPDGAAYKWRVEKAMQEYRRKIESGEVLPPL